MVYSSIVDPNSKQLFPLHSDIGKTILGRYVRAFQAGGGFAPLDSAQEIYKFKNLAMDGTQLSSVCRLWLGITSTSTETKPCTVYIKHFFLNKYKFGHKVSKKDFVQSACGLAELKSRENMPSIYLVKLSTEKQHSRENQRIWDVIDGLNASNADNDSNDYRFRGWNIHGNRIYTIVSVMHEFINLSLTGATGNSPPILEFTTENTENTEKTKQNAIKSIFKYLTHQPYDNVVCLSGLRSDDINYKSDTHVFIVGENQYALKVSLEKYNTQQNEMAKVNEETLIEGKMMLEAYKAPLPTNS